MVNYSPSPRDEGQWVGVQMEPMYQCSFYSPSRNSYKNNSKNALPMKSALRPICEFALPALQLIAIKNEKLVARVSFRLGNDLDSHHSSACNIQHSSRNLVSLHFRKVAGIPAC